ncbi:MAG: hypothetical protein WBX14_05315 [Candidatus Udaeobacter sp.]
MLRTPRSLAIFLALLCGITASDSQSPSDRVFLTERVPVRTHSGLIGFPPGTALHVVSTNGDTSHVTDGAQTFDVSNNKLTTDANLAARLAQNENAAQEAAAQASTQQMEAYRQAQAAKRAQQERQAAALRQAQQQQEAEAGRQEQAAARQQQVQLQRAQRAQAAKKIAGQNRQDTNRRAAQQQQALSAAAHKREVEQFDSTLGLHPGAVVNDYSGRLQDSEHAGHMRDARGDWLQRVRERQAELPTNP